MHIYVKEVHDARKDSIRIYHSTLADFPIGGFFVLFYAIR